MSKQSRIPDHIVYLLCDRQLVASDRAAVVI